MAYYLPRVCSGAPELHGPCCRAARLRRVACVYLLGASVLGHLGGAGDDDLDGELVAVLLGTHCSCGGRRVGRLGLLLPREALPQRNRRHVAALAVAELAPHGACVLREMGRVRRRHRAILGAVACVGSPCCGGNRDGAVEVPDRQLVVGVPVVGCSTDAWRLDRGAHELPHVDQHGNNQGVSRISNSHVPALIHAGTATRTQRGWMQSTRAISLCNLSTDVARRLLYAVACAKTFLFRCEMQ